MSANLPSEMTAAVLHGKEDLRIERLALPKPGPGELLLKVEAALTCGTDLKVFRRGYHASMIKPPAVFGHECAGTVAALGEGAKGFALGDRVVAANSAPCGSCASCKRGQANLCEDLLFYNGAYAQYVVLPARIVAKNTLPIPAALAFEEAAMIEPLACVVQGLRITPAAAGYAVGVLGLGPIGLMFVALLKHAGAHVVAAGRRAPRLALAKQLGADEVVDTENEHGWRERLLSGKHLDLVVEATGQPEAWAFSIAWVRRGGTVNLFSGCPKGTSVAVDTNRLHYDQITLTSSFHHTPEAVREALALIENRVVKPKEFIGGEIALAQLPELFKKMAAAQGAVKTCVRP